MEYINDLYDLCETIAMEIRECNEKIRQGGGKLTGADIEYVDKLTHSLKSIKTTIAMIEAEDGYSSEDGSYEDGSYNDGNGGSYRGGNGSYNRGGSYARGRGSNAKRDRRGRYSSYGYSRKGDMADELRELMKDAPNEQIRKDIQRLVEKVEQM